MPLASCFRCSITITASNADTLAEAIEAHNKVSHATPAVVKGGLAHP